MDERATSLFWPDTCMTNFDMHQRGGMHCKTEQWVPRPHGHWHMDYGRMFARMLFGISYLRYNKRHLVCRQQTGNSVCLCPAWKPPGAIHSGLGVHTYACDTDSGYGSVEVMKAGARRWLGSSSPTWLACCSEPSATGRLGYLYERSVWTTLPHSNMTLHLTTPSGHCHHTDGDPRSSSTEELGTSVMELGIIEACFRTQVGRR